MSFLVVILAGPISAQSRSRFGPESSRASAAFSRGTCLPTSDAECDYRRDTEPTRVEFYVFLRVCGFDLTWNFVELSSCKAPDLHKRIEDLKARIVSLVAGAFEGDVEN